MTSKPSLQCYEMALPIKLAALWAATMSCYAYGDLIGHWLPGQMDRMIEGNLAPLGAVSPGMLTGIAVFMSIPAAMIALSVLLPPMPNRVLNMLLGTIYSVMVAGTMLSAPPFYIYLGGVSVVLTATIAWSAWKWPRDAATEWRPRPEGFSSTSPRAEGS